MEFGASIFFTDYSITPAGACGRDGGARALIRYGPPNIRTSRTAPQRGGDTELDKRYYDVMDRSSPLTAQPAATKSSR